MKVINTYMVSGLLPMIGEYQIYNNIHGTPAFVALHECENSTWMIETNKGFAMITNNTAEELITNTKERFSI